MKFDSMYYRLLRIATKDYKKVISNKDLVLRFERATPLEWAQYFTSSKVIKITRDKSPAILHKRLQSSLKELIEQSERTLKNILIGFQGL